MRFKWSVVEIDNDLLARLPLDLVKSDAVSQFDSVTFCFDVYFFVSRLKFNFERFAAECLS